MLTVDSLFNLYAFFIKHVHKTDIKFTAVKTDLFLLTYAVQIQTEVLAQAVCISFTYIIYDANMCRITLLCQTD